MPGSAEWGASALPSWSLRSAGCGAAGGAEQTDAGGAATSGGSGDGASMGRGLPLASVVGTSSVSRYSQASPMCQA